MTVTEDHVAAALRAAVTGDVRRAAPLAGLTTLKVGGPAAILVRAASVEDLVAVARACGEADMPWLIVGRGSNLLVSDAGWRGVVVTLGKNFRGVTIEGDRVVAGGAESMPALAHHVARHGLGGLAYGVAIPGTVGGAVRMNAGAHGGETSQILEWAEVLRLARDGVVERLPASALRMTYRSTQLPADAVVLRAGFVLRRMSDERLMAEMNEMKQWRRSHQPLGEPSCGSVFRNPDGDSAGRLIDSAGLKGHRVGGAQVSTKHANFIVTEPGARADDVHRLIDHVRTEVERVHGARLVPEVVLVGFSSDDFQDAEGEHATPGPSG